MWPAHLIDVMMAEGGGQHSEMLSNFSKITYLVSGRLHLLPQVFLPLKDNAFSHCLEMNENMNPYRWQPEAKDVLDARWGLVCSQK